jgi:hypothetical protein
VMTLRIRVRDMPAADMLDLAQQGRRVQYGPAQIDPIVPSTTKNNIVDGGKGELLMVQVSVTHVRA